MEAVAAQHHGYGAPELLAMLLQVITDQPYIPQLIRSLEAQGIRPVPVFINGAFNW